MNRGKMALVAALCLVFAAGPAVCQDDQAPAAPAPAPARKVVRQPVKPPAKAGDVMPVEATPEGVVTVPAGPAPRPAASKTPASVSATPGAPAASAPAPRGRSAQTQATPAKPRIRDGQIRLGALVPLTGPLAAQGKSAKAALGMAAEDLTAFFAASGSTARVSLVQEDTASTGPRALEALKALNAAGVRLVIGPYSDNEVDAVLEYAAKNGMVLLSQGSAGPYLAVRKGQSLLRFAPSDAYQAEALAVMASQEGCTQIITIWEGDMYGDELVTHVKGQFVNLGGQVIPGTRFRPEVTQFASYVADLKQQIDKQVKDKKSLGIVVAARGGQTAAILREAAKLGGLEGCKWYGGDDAALRGAIIQDPDVAKFAAQVRIAFARYGETGNSLYTAVEKRLEDTIGSFVDTQAMLAYDLAWLSAKASLFAGDDPASLRRAVIGEAERFYGTTGWLALTEQGERRENYSYDFWTIRQMEGKYFWVKTARYQFDPGSVKQLILNAPEKE